MGSDTKIDILQDDKTHPLIPYEPLAQRAIGPLDRGGIITKTGTLSEGQKVDGK